MKELWGYTYSKLITTEGIRYKQTIKIPLSPYKTRLKFWLKGYRKQKEIYI